MAMTLMPINLAVRSVAVNYLTARDLLDKDDMVEASASLQEYAAELGIGVWLERSARRLAQRAAYLEDQLRVAPPEDRAALEDAARTSRTNLVLGLRALEQSRGGARRPAERSEPNEPRLHLQLVRPGRNSLTLQR